MPDSRMVDIEDEYENEDEEEEAPPDAYEKQMVFVQFRSRGVRGPTTASGNRGRVIMEGSMPLGLVAYLQRMKTGPEAALCETLSIWMSEAPGGDPWKMLVSTNVAPAERKAQVDAAQAEHDAQMQALASQVQAVKSETRDATLELEFLKKRIGLEQAALERLQQEIDTVRGRLEDERRRCDEERELLKLERAQRIQERATLAQQDAAERNAQQDQATKSFAAIEGLLAASAQQFKQQLESNREAIAALKESLNVEVQSTTQMMKSEQSVQQLVQMAKLNAVTNATELKDRMDSVPTPAPQQVQQPIPYLEIIDRALAGLGVSLSMITGRPIPTIPTG